MRAMAMCCNRDAGQIVSTSNRQITGVRWVTTQEETQQGKRRFKKKLKISEKIMNVRVSRLCYGMLGFGMSSL